MLLIGNIIINVSFVNAISRNFLRKERRVHGEFTMSCEGLPM